MALVKRTAVRGSAQRMSVGCMILGMMQEEFCLGGKKIGLVRRAMALLYLFLDSPCSSFALGPRRMRWTIAER